MIKSKYILAIIFLVLTFFYDCNSQPNINYTSKKINYHINITPKIKVQSKAEKCLEDMGLIKITDSLPQILVDLKYSTTDNFVGIDFYDDMTNAYCQYECFQKLRNAYNILQEIKPGYTFIIYDAVRSQEAQQLMWDSVDVAPAIKHWYVANPQKGSIHNYGMALDISIVDTLGNVLDMGTEFDYFGELAYPDKTDHFHSIGELSDDQYENRKLLFDIMAKSYMYVSKTEWWHFSAGSLNYSKEKYQIFSLEKCKNNDN